MSLYLWACAGFAARNTPKNQKIALFDAKTAPFPVGSEPFGSRQDNTRLPEAARLKFFKSCSKNPAPSLSCPALELSAKTLIFHPCP
jgi:hypothetical protein